MFDHVYCPCCGAKYFSKAKAIYIDENGMCPSCDEEVEDDSED